MQLKGDAVSKGFAVGEVYIYSPVNFDISQNLLDECEIEKEEQKFIETKNNVENELVLIKNAMQDNNNENAEILQAQITMLSDTVMISEISKNIKNKKMNGALAVNTVYTKYANMLSKSKDALISARAADIRDILRRFLCNWYGVENTDLSKIANKCIIVAHDLLPSDTANLNVENTLAILTEIGQATSHTAILAKSYGIPAILGVADVTKTLSNGQEIYVNAVSGDILIEPNSQQLSEFEKCKSDYLKEQEIVKTYLNKKVLTKDNECISVNLNIGCEYINKKNEIENIDGVGLFRSEFLYMFNTQLPSEQEQFNAYKNTLNSFDSGQVVLRTLDIGGDKTLPYMQLDKEENPFLGKRALRLCFEKTDVFKTQIKAALRASAFGNLCILLPMAGSMEDIRNAKEIIEECKKQLREEQISFNEDIKVGVMVEIPSMALIAHQAAKEVDFFSIGTNDLVQYTMAADRMNPSVVPYYQSYHPAIFKLIKMVVDAGDANGKPVSVCGELAAEPNAVVILAGLGIKKLSVNASCVATVKKAISSFSLQQAKQIANDVLCLDSESSVMQYMDKLNIL